MENIYVTKAFLPPIEEFDAYVAKIWKSGQLTNQGQLLQEFQQETSKYLGVNNFHFVSNGTIALQLALRALDITDGEIITTPFSYVATASSILWERCTPVFVDIEPDTFSIDVDKIEAAITPQTKAIMPVHVFGYACDVDGIEVIAKKHDLNVIYDGAHAFGVEYKGRSLLSYGDITTCSFHATKLFHTIEGGGIVTQDSKISQKLELMKRFGHEGDTHVMLGINAKASEFQAAMGLCNLKYISEGIDKRKAIYELYDELLNPRYVKSRIKGEVKHNYSYYPVVFVDEKTLLTKLNQLNEANIFPRRYFFPSLNTLPYVERRDSCPVAEDISKRIICLPLYADLSHENVIKICEIMNS